MEKPHQNLMQCSIVRRPKQSQSPWSDGNGRRIHDFEQKTDPAEQLRNSSLGRNWCKSDDADKLDEGLIEWRKKAGQLWLSQCSVAKMEILQFEKAGKLWLLHCAVAKM